MSFDLSSLVPVDAELPASTRTGAGRPKQPNPFVDNGWLSASKGTNGKAVPVPGSQAHGVVGMIRRASNELNLGVSVRATLGDEKLEALDLVALALAGEGEKLEDDERFTKVYDADEIKQVQQWANKNKNKSVTVFYLAKDRIQRTRKSSVLGAPADEMVSEGSDQEQPQY